MQTSSKVQDERELRSIEAETAKFEQQNDASRMDLLADNWVCLGKKVLTKADFQEAVKRNFDSHGKSANPYTIEKKSMRVDLFGDTAVVTYIKEYRQVPDSANFFDERRHRCLHSWSTWLETSANEDFSRSTRAQVELTKAEGLSRTSGDKPCSRQ